MENGMKKYLVSLVIIGSAFAVQSAGAMFNDLAKNFPGPVNPLIQTGAFIGKSPTSPKSTQSPLNAKKNFVPTPNIKKLTTLTDFVVSNFAPTNLSVPNQESKQVPLDYKNVKSLLQFLPEQGGHIVNIDDLIRFQGKFDVREELIKKLRESLLEKNNKIQQLENNKQSLNQEKNFVTSALETEKLNLEQLKNDKQLLVMQYDRDLKERDDLLDKLSIDYSKLNADSQNALIKLENEKHILEDKVFKLQCDANIGNLREVVNKFNVVEKFEEENNKELEKLKQEKVELEELINSVELKNREALQEKTKGFSEKLSEIDKKTVNLNKELLEHTEALKKAEAFKARVIYWSKAALFTGLAVTAVAALKMPTQFLWGEIHLHHRSRLLRFQPERS
ncbi:MAG: hypothetical protein UV38_C0006G0002 [candidate division TM6 bacterium GW2011_GWE2_42_60]|nr:MAG: hypothetical protein UV38_C0006G0002 [candidate division TM6 bacterium GW2011_GWE2_42_60]